MDWLKTILGDSYTDEIDKAVSKEIGKGFVARADFNSLNEEKKNLMTQLADRDSQLEELKKVDAAGLQAKINELQEANKTAKAEHEAELAKVKLNSKIDAALTGVKDPVGVKAHLNMDEIKLDGDKVLGLDGQLEQLKKDYAFYFETQTQGKTGMQQNAGGGAGDEKTFADEIKSEVFGK
jgi:hypothetical protein